MGGAFETFLLICGVILLTCFTIIIMILTAELVCTFILGEDLWEVLNIRKDKRIKSWRRL